MTLRFWEKVEKTSSCWVWVGSRTNPRPSQPEGYGIFCAAPGKKVLAHRASWGFTYGPIPKRMNILHHCDYPPCVRPSHLFLGTQKDNVQDALQKSRWKVGEQAGKVKLTAEEVLLIREIGHSLPSRVIGEMFSIGTSQVDRIRNKETWRHLP